MKNKREPELSASAHTFPSRPFPFLPHAGQTSCRGAFSHIGQDSPSFCRSRTKVSSSAGAVHEGRSGVGFCMVCTFFCFPHSPRAGFSRWNGCPPKTPSSMWQRVNRASGPMRRRFRGRGPLPSRRGITPARHPFGGWTEEVG